jgi:pimeloyl-ACP methyl ester carboxylesterase
MRVGEECMISLPVSVPDATQRSAYPPAHLVQRGSGPAVVLLHGWGASSALFAPAMNGLAHAFTLIAPDFPGFGATAPPPVGWSVGDYAEWVISLLDVRGIARPHIIGHSFGGRVAIKLASRWPDRVDKLVLTGSAGIPPARGLQYHLQVRTFKSLRWMAQVPGVPSPLKDRARAWVTRRGSSDYRQAAGTVRETFVKVVNEDLRPYLPRIKAPTLLIWGECDEETPLADGQLMERLIPDSGLIVFDGAGHYAYLERTARFCHIVETFFRGTA